jgi:hypothetical protein
LVVFGGRRTADDKPVNGLAQSLELPGCFCGGLPRVNQVLQNQLLLEQGELCFGEFQLVEGIFVRAHDAVERGYSEGVPRIKNGARLPCRRQCPLWRQAIDYGGKEARELAQERLVRKPRLSG